MSNSELRNMLKEYAMSFVGTWYSWGGDDPRGFDCSGFVIELLKSTGILPRKYDTTAHGLYQLFSHGVTPHPKTGDLVFYWSKDGKKVVHVEMCISQTLTIGASGGGSKTRTKDDAIRDNAFIKMRPINHERGVVTICDPFRK